MPNSSERRVTVHGSVYPKLREWAERDGLTVADVANAILLQTIRPYGSATAPTFAPTETRPARTAPDPYQTAAITEWG